MSLLIDGYNLIFGTSVESRGRGGALERARTGLIEFLAFRIDRAKYKSIGVVFDSANAPPGLPAFFEEHGIDVHFARDHADADEMLEELISRSTAPGRLTVVSSDHRVQRAARRRGASAVDSHVWFAEQRAFSTRAAKVKEVKPAGPLSAGETEAWVRFFGEVQVEEEAAGFAKREAAADAQRRDAPAEEKKVRKRGKRRDSRGGEKELRAGMLNPFPPGYASDLFE
jgi:predicted RNA-binding protein with PIN domain